MGGMMLQICTVSALVPIVLLLVSGLVGLASPPILSDNSRQSSSDSPKIMQNSGPDAVSSSAKEEPSAQQTEPRSSADNQIEKKKSTAVQADAGGLLAGFSRVKISADFADVISRGDLVLESGGGKIIDLPDGSRWVLGVGMAAVDPEGGGAEVIRQRTVAEQRARKAIISEFESSSVESTTIATSTATVALRDGAEVAASSDQLKEQIQSKVEGTLKGLKPAGSWYSQDGQLFYLALCAKIP